MAFEYASIDGVFIQNNPHPPLGDMFLTRLILLEMLKKAPTKTDGIGIMTLNWPIYLEVGSTLMLESRFVEIRRTLSWL
jgi:hypothetical protein